MKILNYLKEHRILLLILLIGTVLRLYKLDYQSLWIDEIFSMRVSATNNDLLFIYDFLKNHDPHPPLYYFLIHFFFLLFGQTTFVLKLFSAVIGILGLIAIYFLGKEIKDKKLGLIVSFLTAINYFHIYYSQEGRMYSLLFFTSCIALIFFIRFYRDYNLKTMSLFVLGSLFLIYTHFFGVFELVSLYFLILIKILRERNFKLFKLTFLSGILTILFYIPSIIIVFSNPKRDSIWIPSPTFETFEQMFKEFFGFNSALNFIILTLIIISILFLIYQKVYQKITFKANEPNFVLLFLSIIVLTIILSLLYSFYTLPIVVSRYFISLLPLILVLLSFIIYQTKLKYIQTVVLLVFCYFSLQNLFIDKKFYENFYKTQFKHSIDFMLSKNSKDPIVCKLGEFYLRFYLNDVNYTQSVREFDINSYIQNLINTKASLNDFWYFDAHLPNYSPTVETKLFLEENFFTDVDTAFFDATVKHFKVKNYKKNAKIDIESFSILSFPNALFDEKGRLAFYEQSTLVSDLVLLKKGVYEIEVIGQSFPSPPILNENARIKMKINNITNFEFDLSDEEKKVNKKMEFKQMNDELVEIKITFENDYFIDNKDRNAFIKEIKFKSK